MGGSIEGFVEMMNEEAARIGATGTHFANANGLTNEDHYMTAYDLYLMFHEALKYEKFRDIIGTKTYTASYKGRTDRIKPHPGVSATTTCSERRRCRRDSPYSEERPAPHRRLATA